MSIRRNSHEETNKICKSYTFSIINWSRSNLPHQQWSEKTSKHVTFPFSIKRKTGSKIVINWTNKFGHGISYDDVLILETYLAMEHSKDQLHRSFSPAIIQPSQFVTFVWDNNEINPESLKGLSLHCTNGIVIQSSSVVLSVFEPSSTDTSVLLQPRAKQRIKKFRPLPLEMPSYGPRGNSTLAQCRYSVDHR